MSRIRFEIEKFCMILYFVFLGLFFPLWLLSFGSNLLMVFAGIWYVAFFFYVDEAKSLFYFVFDKISVFLKKITPKKIKNKKINNDNGSNIPARGDDLRYDLNLDFKDAIFGQIREIKFSHLEKCEDNGVKKVKKICTVNIPAGVDTGTKLRVAGEGNVGLKGGPPGDLYIFIKVKNEPYFKRNDVTIHSEISINNKQANLGDTIKIPTIDGMVNLEIPSGTKPDSIITLKGRGVPQLGNPAIRGDHQVLIKVV